MWSDADITNTVLASVGLLVAGGGLVAVFIQIRKVRSATEATQEATSKAMQTMAERVTTADLDMVRTALRSTLDNLDEGDHQLVRRDCQDVRERLIGLRARPGLENQQERLTTAITSVAEAQNALQDGDEASAWTDVRSNVSAALDSVVELQQHALFFKEEGSAREQRS